VFAWIGGRKVHMNFHAGHSILLEPQFTDEETMCNVLRLDDELDFAIRRNGHGGRNDIIFRCDIGGIETDRVSRGSTYQFWLDTSKLDVWSSVSEIPLKLRAGNFDL